MVKISSKRVRAVVEKNKMGKYKTPDDEANYSGKVKVPQSETITSSKTDEKNFIPTKKGK